MAGGSAKGIAMPHAMPHDAAAGREPGTALPGGADKPADRPYVPVLPGSGARPPLALSTGSRS